MNILPLRFIHDDDRSWLDLNIVNFAKLYHLKFPVADSLVVIPPEGKISGEELLKIPPPADFKDNPRLWQKVIKDWLFDLERLNTLKPKIVSLVKEISSMGEVYIDKLERDSVINILSGSVNPKILNTLDKLVFEMDKRLFLPYIYSFVSEKGDLRFTKLTPLTHSKEVINHVEKEINTIRLSQTSKNFSKTPIKVFKNLASDFELRENFDGLIIDAKNYQSFDNLVFSLVEAATTFPNLHVILSLSAKFGTDFKREVEAFLFARREKKLLNISLLIPFVHSLDEFLKIKRDLAVLGVSRKGSLKVWLELALPENFLNIEEYILAGIDGTFFNLDKLNDQLIGVSEENPQERQVYKRKDGLLRFIEESLRVLNKAKIPSIASGQLAQDSEVLKFLAVKGIWGINILSKDNSNYHEYLRLFI